ncbi:MAG: hypothetical protein II885_14650 [Oscillospiraceae bacterium]|nr:hypothetical protein [Oscillospiraceae bacterium]
MKEAVGKHNKIFKNAAKNLIKPVQGGRIFLNGRHGFTLHARIEAHR